MRRRKEIKRWTKESNIQTEIRKKVQRMIETIRKVEKRKKDAYR
jgi:hypothetical protein